MAIPVEVMKAGVDNPIDRPPIFPQKSYRSLPTWLAGLQTFQGPSKLSPGIISTQGEEHYSKTLAKQPPDIVAIASMLISLKFEVEKSQPLQFPSVFLSLPNFVALNRQIYKERFILTAELAGLKLFSGRNVLATHTGMIEQYGIYHWPAIEIGDWKSVSDIECEQYNGRLTGTVMSVGYGSENLGLMLLPREDGWFMPDLAIVTDKLKHGCG
jgi:hypothetical protein